MISYRYFVVFILCIILVSCKNVQQSPNGDISLNYVKRATGDASFVVTYSDGEGNKHEAITISEIGIAGKLTDKHSWQLKSISSPVRISESYTMPTGKRKECSNEAFEYLYTFTDSQNEEMSIRFRIYNDGVAFRYELKGLDNEIIQNECTTYRIPEGNKRWMQKYSEGYEDFYPQSTTGEQKSRHWGYPALVQADDNTWVMITEADIEKHHSASFLSNENVSTDYRVVPAENKKAVSGDWHSPWRILMVGSLADIVESTLVTDVSAPCRIDATEWIKPGSVSWIYWAHNHGSKDYQIVKQYIDMAYELKLPYVLIDWQWDVMNNGGDINTALQYAAEKNVRTLLWYNSSTVWAAPEAGPLYKLNTPAARKKEYSMLQEKGVAGVKIDFFAGDTQETMEYCIDLLEDAAKHKLMVNFHGATIPRGWQRTYPNFMTAEGVYGAEWYNNRPTLTDKAAAHNTTLPFTRNVVGSMDYTPCTFSDSQHPHITTHTHELALSIVFESALQHWADRPESYLAQPDAVRKFMGELPTVWDDTRLVSGYPGESVVIARKKDDVWYIGGLNGLDEPQTLSTDWSFLNNSNYSVTFFTDGDSVENPWAIYTDTISKENLPTSVLCKARGGFSIVIRELN